MRLIKSTPKGKQRVYDIEVADVHNFYANGINVHNCATDGGVSVIKDDGSVSSYSVGNYGTYGVFAVGGNKNYWWFGGKWNSNTSILAYNKNTGTFTDYNISSITSAFGLAPDETYSFPASTDSNLIAIYSPTGGNGINWLRSDGFALIDFSNESTTNYLKCKIDRTFNTGWMHGDIKGAFLSDTDATNVTAGSNLITSGDFSSSTGWTLGSGWTISGGKLNKTTTDNNSAIYTATGLTVGKAYTFSIDVDTLGLGTIYFYTLGQFSVSLPTTGTHSVTVVANSSTLNFGITGISGNGSVLDNASLTVGEADRSVNNKGLQVFGTITKQPVAGAGATAAELVAYSGWSASNYLQQPYNSDLDFGTGDFSIMGWIKTTRTSDYGDLISRSDAGSVGYANQTEGSWFWQIFPNRTSGFYYRTVGDSATGVVITTALQSGIWTHFVITRKSRTLSFYYNGILVYSNTPNNAALSFSDSTSSKSLNIGWQGSSYNYPATEETLSLVRISKSAPSPEQIKKIYEDEKVLFQEGAQCTLYGSSDAVTALAYDDTTDLLSVGTSSGRSDFQGLRRINNTTTAVTTAISASNGLIAEQ